MKKSVQEIARIVGGTVVGDASFIPEGITNIENPSPDTSHSRRMKKGSGHSKPPGSPV